MTPEAGVHTAMIWALLGLASDRHGWASSPWLFSSNGALEGYLKVSTWSQDWAGSGKSSYFDVCDIWKRFEVTVIPLTWRKGTLNAEKPVMNPLISRSAGVSIECSRPRGSAQACVMRVRVALPCCPRWGRGCSRWNACAEAAGRRRGCPRSRRPAGAPGSCSGVWNT